VFQNQNQPKVVVEVGKQGSQGIIEITDIVFSTVGPGMFSFGGTRVVTDELKLLVPSLSNGTSSNLTVFRLVLECGILMLELEEVSVLPRSFVLY